MIPRQYLGLWLKEVPAADVGHKVLRYDHADLVSYCSPVVELQKQAP
jgi:hypothetical protein